MAEPAFAFNAKGLITDYKNVLDRFISDFNHVLLETQMQGSIPESSKSLERIAEDILLLQQKTDLLLDAPLNEDLLYDVQTIKDILNQEILLNKRKATLIAAAKDVADLKEIVKNCVKRQDMSNRLIESLDHISHEFYDFLRL